MPSTQNGAHAYLAGRYVSFRIYPLAFAENLKFRKVDPLERVVRYAFENMGNTFSAASITKYLKSEQRTTDNETVYNDSSRPESACILRRCSRYDIKGREFFKTQTKRLAGGSTADFSQSTIIIQSISF